MFNRLKSSLTRRTPSAMGAASSVQNDVRVRYEDFDSLKFCAEIPNCSEKTLAIYACKFPTVIDDRMLRYIVGKLRDDEPYSLVYFHAGIVNRPALRWIVDAYRQIDHNRRKHLVKLYIMHPTFWVRSVHTLMKPILSEKVWRKILTFNQLAELNTFIPVTRFRDTLPKIVTDTDADLNSTSSSMNFKNSSPYPHVGIKLETLRERDQGQLMLFYATISFIESHGLQSPGIYRKTPDKTKMMDHLARLEQGNEEALFSFENANQAAGLLKLFLRELPDSIVPRSKFSIMCDDSIEVSSLIDQVLTDDSVALFRHLAVVANNSTDNLMGTQALAVVFAPILCTAEDVQILHTSIHRIIANIVKLIKFYQVPPAHAAPL